MILEPMVHFERVLNSRETISPDSEITARARSPRRPPRLVTPAADGAVQRALKGRPAQNARGSGRCSLAIRYESRQFYHAMTVT